MYTEYYGLLAAPFQLTPDERYFFASRPHRKAFAYLNYGLSKAEGFVVITGEIGAGKTTVLAHLRASLQDPQLVIAWLTTTQVTADDLLRLIAAAFSMPLDDGATDKASLLLRIETFLQNCHDTGKRACLVIDEAQSLLAESLEELRMLSNFRCEGHALLQIFLVGQPEFRKLILRDDLEQLRQRIVVSFHLTPLDADEMRKYIEHRLSVAGWEGEPIFADGVFAKIFTQTSGVPRKVNLLCDRLLLHGFLAQTGFLTEAEAGEVIRELEEELPTPPSSPLAAPPLPSPAVSSAASPIFAGKTVTAPVSPGPVASTTPERRSGPPPVPPAPAHPAPPIAAAPPPGRPAAAMPDDRAPRWQPWTPADEENEARQIAMMARPQRSPLLLAAVASACLALALLAYIALRP